MNKLITGIIAILAVYAAIVGSVALVGGNQRQSPGESFGASGSRFPNGISANSTSPSAGQVLGTTLKVGSTGKNTAGIWGGECYLFAASTLPSAPTINASSTLVADCQATNPLTSATPAAVALTNPVWAAGDAVFAAPIASSTVVFGGLSVVSATGSSTAGYLTLRVANLTGANLALATTTGIKYQWFYIR